jgi:hypothetical protein
MRLAYDPSDLCLHPPATNTWNKIIEVIRCFRITCLILTLLRPVPGRAQLAIKDVRRSGTDQSE